MDDGKKENAGAFLSLFPLPIVPRVLSLSPVLSLPTTRRGFCVGEGPRFINLSANDDILLGEVGGNPWLGSSKTPRRSCYLFPFLFLSLRVLSNHRTIRLHVTNWASWNNFFERFSRNNTVKLDNGLQTFASYNLLPSHLFLVEQASKL